MVKKSIDELLESWSKLVDRLEATFLAAIYYALYFGILIGILLIIWGLIEWISGWNEINGKRNFVRGIILIIVSTTTLSSIS